MRPQFIRRDHPIAALCYRVAYQSAGMVISFR